jgi:hypothetical protein
MASLIGLFVLKLFIPQKVDENIIQQLINKLYTALKRETGMSIQDLKVECGLSDKEIYLIIGWLMHDHKIVYDMTADRIKIECEEMDLTCYNTYSMT